MCGGGGTKTFVKCPRCEATAFQGQRLAINECDDCGIQYCRSCKDTAGKNDILMCPSCSSHDKSKSGYVEQE